MALMIAEALVPVFFVMVLVYFAGARRIIDNQHVASLNVLLMTFVLPAALFVGVAQTSRSGLEENGKLFLVLVISMLVIFGITFALNHYVFRLSPGENALRSLSVGFPRFPVVRPCNRSRAGDVGSDRTGSDSLGGPPRRISRHPLWVKLWSQVPGRRL